MSVLFLNNNLRFTYSKTPPLIVVCPSIPNYFATLPSGWYMKGLGSNYNWQYYLPLADSSPGPRNCRYAAHSQPAHTHTHTHTLKQTHTHKHTPCTQTKHTNSFTTSPLQPPPLTPLSPSVCLVYIIHEVRTGASPDDLSFPLSLHHDGHTLLTLEAAGGDLSETCLRH